MLMQDGEQMTGNNVLTRFQLLGLMPVSSSLPWSPLKEGLEGIPLFFCFPDLAAITGQHVTNHAINTQSGLLCNRDNESVQYKEMFEQLSRFL